MQRPPGRFLALGDSYTIGEGVAESDRWPVQLARQLRSSGIALADPEIIAQTGWTTDELDAAITERSPLGPYDIVTLQAGVNNQYRGRDAAEFRTQYRSLVSRAVGFAEGISQRVILVSIPDWGVTPFNTSRDRATIAREIDAFNAVIREEGGRAMTRVADITNITRAMSGDVAADGLHPSARVYRQWTLHLAPVASAILRPH
jgi:lysophospholipase L1-like esterase